MNILNQLITAKNYIKNNNELNGVTEYQQLVVKIDKLILKEISKLIDVVEDQ